jgi:hypothetical protein
MAPDGFTIEVKNLHGIQRNSLVTNLKMQVRTGASARIATFGQEITGLDNLTNGTLYIREMAIEGFKSVIMPHQHIISIATAIPVGEAYHTVPYRQNRIAGIQFKIYPIVPAVSSSSKF